MRLTALAAVSLALIGSTTARAAAPDAKVYAPLDTPRYNAGFVDVTSFRRTGSKAEMTILLLLPGEDSTSGFRGRLTRYVVDCDWQTAEELPPRTIYKNNMTPVAEPSPAKGMEFFGPNGWVGKAAQQACGPAAERPDEPRYDLAGAISIARQAFDNTPPALPVPPVPKRADAPPPPWGPRLGWIPQLSIAVLEGDKAVFIDWAQVVTINGRLRTITFWVANPRANDISVGYALRIIDFDCASPTATMTQQSLWTGTGRAMPDRRQSELDVAGSPVLTAVRDAACTGGAATEAFSSLREAADSLLTSR